MGNKLTKSTDNQQGQLSSQELPEGPSKTSTLPASFRRKAHNIGKTGSLPRNSAGLDKSFDSSASFGQRFRKSCRNWARQRGLVNSKENGKLPSESNSKDEVKTEDTIAAHVENSKEPVVESEQQPDIGSIVASLVVEAHKKKMASRAQSRAQSREVLQDESDPNLNKDEEQQEKDGEVIHNTNEEQQEEDGEVIHNKDEEQEDEGDVIHNKDEEQQEDGDVTVNKDEKGQEQNQTFIKDDSSQDGITAKIGEEGQAEIEMIQNKEEKSETSALERGGDGLAEVERDVNRSESDKRIVNADDNADKYDSDGEEHEKKNESLRHDNNKEHSDGEKSVKEEEESVDAIVDYGNESEDPESKSEEGKERETETWMVADQGNKSEITEHIDINGSDNEELSEAATVSWSQEEEKVSLNSEDSEAEQQHSTEKQMGQIISDIVETVAGGSVKESDSVIDKLER